MISGNAKNVLIKEDIIAYEFSFIKSYRSVLAILTEEEINENIKTQIKSITDRLNKIKSEIECMPAGKETLKEIMNIIKYSLSESVFIRHSAYIRYLLKNMFYIEYECLDGDLVEVIMDHYSTPQVFKRESYYVSNMTLDEVLVIPLKIKKYGELFENYTTSYPFKKEKAKEELKLIVNTSGRLQIHENFFLWYTGYVEYYKKTLEVLMNEEGIIPITWRYYIAIMAVSTIQSYYLLKHLQESFILKGGDDNWLVHGLSKVPEKLQKLSRLNNLLAHQPWKITTQEINELLASNKSGWTRDELVHASLILVNYHRFSSIVESLKINFVENFNPFNVRTVEKRKNSHEERDGKTKLYNNLLEMNEEENIEENQKKSDRKLSGDDLKIVYSFDENNYSALFNKHISNFCTLYSDFDVYSDTFLSNMNFSWNNEGYYILENIFKKGIDSLNDEINFISELSSSTIGGDFKILDTFHFRNSIRCYIEKIFGIVNEDYDYRKTNVLLHKSTKTFVKNVACLPQKISKMDLPVLLNTFSYEEIFHLIFLVSLCKARVQLTYLSHTIYEIIKSID